MYELRVEIPMDMDHSIIIVFCHIILQLSVLHKILVLHFGKHDLVDLCLQLAQLLELL